MNQTTRRNPAAVALGAALTVSLALFSCAEPVSFENPFDPEVNGSPLGTQVVVTDFTVNDDTEGNKVATVGWESIPGAVQYEVRIDGDGDTLYQEAQSGTVLDNVPVERRTVYTAFVRYQIEVEYQGERSLAWSPFAAGVTFDTGEDPAGILPVDVNVAEYQVTYDPSTPSQAQLVITYEIADWDGDPRIFVRIEPDPYETVQQEILTTELTFYLPIDWDRTYQVIAFLEDGSSETIEVIEVGTLEEQDPLVQQLVYSDPVVDDAVVAQSNPDTRVSDFTELEIGAGATDLTPISGLTNIFFLDLDRSGVTDLSPVANLTALDQIEFVETGVSDMSPLSKLPSLRTIWAPRSQVSDITPILSVTTLEQFNFYELDGLTSVAGIGGLSNLRWVNLSNNPNLTTGVDELASVTGMESVNLTGSLAIPGADYGAIETAYTGVTGFQLTRPDGSVFAP